MGPKKGVDPSIAPDAKDHWLVSGGPGRKP